MEKSKGMALLLIIILNRTDHITQHQKSLTLKGMRLKSSLKNLRSDPKIFLIPVAKPQIGLYI